jgi:hypothetical protein
MKRIFTSLSRHFMTNAFIVLCVISNLQLASGQTYTIGGVNYTPCGNTETVTAPFNSVFGGVTTGAYSGMVRLTVSGTGASLGSVPGDAFYIFIPGSPSHDVNHYQLVTTIQGNVHHGTNSINDAYRHIVYDIDAGFATTPPYTPPYHANNTYSFIINMNTLTPNNPNPVPLRLGVNDGNYGDNFCSGCTNNYVVQVTQLCAPPPCGDTDNDGVCDDDDNCPATANTNQADADNDGAGDACDLCPNDANKTAPGQCGCGIADTDSDSDGTADCNDLCPNDANKIAPGQCGCGNPDTDTDGDGVANCLDNCDNTANPNQADSDCDGVGNACDVCPGGNDAIDNNNDGLPDCKYPPAFADITSGWKCGNNNQKVLICHNGNTLCVAPSAIAAHIAHGDYLGGCGNASCGGQNLIAPGSNGMSAQMAEHEQLEMFPNPAANEVGIYLHGFGEAQAVELSIFDVSGKMVWQKKLEEGQFNLTLDLTSNGIGNGMYLVRVTDGSQLITRRLVVSKY